MKLGLLFLLLTGWAYAADLERLAGCIAQVEGNRVRAVEPRTGARGCWQIKRVVWVQHSRAPHWWASSPVAAHQAEAQRVVQVHLRWLAEVLENPTPYRIALAWNAGAGATNGCRVSDAQADYAQRVRNLYEEKR